MSALVYMHADTAADALIVLDVGRRTYMALGRDGSRYHLIAPLEAGHPLVGDGIRQAGQLGCTCKAGVFRGTCYRVAEAEAFELGRLPEAEFAEAVAPAGDELAWAGEAVPHG